MKKQKNGELLLVLVLVSLFSLLFSSVIFGLPKKSSKDNSDSQNHNSVSQNISTQKNIRKRGANNLDDKNVDKESVNKKIRPERPPFTDEPNKQTAENSNQSNENVKHVTNAAETNRTLIASITATEPIQSQNLQEKDVESIEVLEKRVRRLVGVINDAFELSDTIHNKNSRESLERFLSKFNEKIEEIIKLKPNPDNIRQDNYKILLDCHLKASEKIFQDELLSKELEGIDTTDKKNTRSYQA